MPVIVLSKKKEEAPQQPKIKRIFKAISRKFSEIRYSHARLRVEPLVERIEKSVSNGCTEEMESCLWKEFAKLTHFEQGVAKGALNISWVRLLGTAIDEITVPNPDLWIAFLKDKEPRSEWMVLKISYARGQEAFVCDKCAALNTTAQHIANITKTHFGHGEKNFLHQLDSSARLSAKQGIFPWIIDRLEQLNMEKQAALIKEGYDLSGIKFD